MKTTFLSPETRKILNLPKRPFVEVGPYVKTIVVIDKQKQKMYINDNKFELPKYKQIEFSEFSPDGSHVAFINREEGPLIDLGRRGGVTRITQNILGYKVVADGKEQKLYEGVHDLHFAPDSSSMAYIAAVKEGAKGRTVVFNGAEGKFYDSVRALVLGTKGRVAYIVQKGSDELAVIDGVEGKAYRKIGNLMFSPDSTHVVFQAYQTKAFVVIDGHEGKAYDEIRSLQILNDGQVLYLARQGDQWMTIAGNVETIVPHTDPFLYVRPDGKFYYYLVRDNEGWTLYEGARALAKNFKLDYHFEVGEFFPFWGGGNDKLQPYLVVRSDWRYMCIFGDIIINVGGYPTFSPDRKRVAYSINESGRQAMVTDGKTGKEYQSVEIPFFSPDSKHIAYLAFKSGRYIIVIDGKEIEPKGEIFSTVRREGGVPISPLYFSANSKLVAYVEARDDAIWWVVEKVHWQPWVLLREFVNSGVTYLSRN